jgi:GT2 family glycosyltransferase
MSKEGGNPDIGIPLEKPSPSAYQGKVLYKERISGKEGSVAQKGRSMTRTPFISVIIPNYNGARTIGKCLEAVHSSDYPNFEVIVVDDCSEDGSIGTIRRYPSRLIRLPVHSGAARARNMGAENSRGEALFFIDSDCIVRKDTLRVAGRAFRELNDGGSGVLIGGTYTLMPHDRGFFSTFQSVFINYSETKAPMPDYIATHAMLISRRLFAESGGFPEDFLPILEDVEFSHRVKRRGIRLLMAPGLAVEHIFNFSLLGSLRNAFRKSKYWTMYSMKNKDLLRDSGTASVELKTNTLSFSLCLLLVLPYALTGNGLFILAGFSAQAFNLFVNRSLIRALLKAAGPWFALKALLYYLTLYPAAVGSGGLMGLLRSLRR